RIRHDTAGLPRTASGRAGPRDGQRIRLPGAGLRGRVPAVEGLIGSGERPAVRPLVLELNTGSLTPGRSPGRSLVLEVAPHRRRFAAQVARLRLGRGGR